MNKEYLKRLIMMEIEGAFKDDEKKADQIIEHVENVLINKARSFINSDEIAVKKDLAAQLVNGFVWRLEIEKHQLCAVLEMLVGMGYLSKEYSDEFQSMAYTTDRGH